MNIFNIPKGFLKKRKRYDTINDMKIPYINLDIHNSDNNINGEYVYPGYPERGFTFTCDIASDMQDNCILRIICDNTNSKSKIYEFKEFNVTPIEELQFFKIIKEMINNPDRTFYRKCWNTSETSCRYITYGRFNKVFLSYFIRDDGIYQYEEYRPTYEDILANDWVEKVDD